MESARAARVLGVDITATPEQVRDACRRRALEVHPDTSGGDADAMVELNAAYQALTARAGPDWEFVAAATPHETWADTPPDGWDGEGARPSGGGMRQLRRFSIALVVIGVVMTTIVFIAGTGYDWSVAP